MDSLYGGIRAGRTGVSVAVLLRRDDTSKGKTGVAPLSVPALVNGLDQGDTGTSTPTVFLYTPGAGSNYTVLRYWVRANVKPSSIACVPTGGGTTVNLAEIGSKYAPPSMGGALGMFGGVLLPVEYQITVTWESSNSNAIVRVSSYAAVGSVGTPAGAETTGSPAVPTVSVSAGAGPALVIDFGAGAGGTSGITPGAGQTAEAAMAQDGAFQAFLRASSKTGSGTVSMSESVAGPGAGAIFAVALLAAAGTTMSAAYARQGAAAVDIPLVALAGPTAAWVAGGWAEIDAVKTPGLYRLDIPDAAPATGADWVGLEVVCAGALEYVERFALETRRALRRGQAYSGITFLLQTADGSPATGKTITATRFLDGVSGSLAGSVTEKTGGVYAFSVTSGDTDAIFGLYLFTAPGAVPRAVLLIFEP